MHSVSVELSRVTGRVKPLHGVCCAPYVISKGREQSYVDKYFRFPDFSADENDLASYSFCYTDEYIAAIEATGCKTYYRLGVSIE